MFDRNFTMRIDSSTDALLKTLTKDLKHTKSEIIRHSLRLLKELIEIKRQYGQIELNTEKGQELLVLLN